MKLIDRILDIYEENKRGPRLHLWGLLARVLVQDEAWPLATTLCLWFLRELFMSWIKVPGRKTTQKPFSNDW